MSEAERVRGLVAPFAEERDMYTKQIKAMLDEEKRRAQNHVSSQWIYGIHMAAARAYEKVLSIVELLEHRTRAMEQMYRDHLNTCVGGIFVREAALAAEPTPPTDVTEILREGFHLVESAFAHVSHGGPTRKDAEDWLAKAKAVLGE